MTLLRPFSIVLLSCSLPACEPPEPEPAEPEVQLVCAATAGGDGAAPGYVHVLAPSTEGLAARVAQVAVATPAAAGIGGVGELGPDGVDGMADARNAEIEVDAYPGFAFDAASVESGTRIEIVGDGGENVIAITELGDPPRFEVEALIVRAGATLSLSCDVRIVAGRVLVEEGASLVLQSTSTPDCTLGVGVAAREPGQRGAVASIEAGSFELHGTIDLSGSDGAPGAAGGSGGGLTIVAEQVVLGERARIDVSGGAGGDGVDEEAC